MHTHRHAHPHTHTHTHTPRHTHIPLSCDANFCLLLVYERYRLPQWIHSGWKNPKTNPLKLFFYLKTCLSLDSSTKKWTRPEVVVYIHTFFFLFLLLCVTHTQTHACLLLFLKMHTRVRWTTDTDAKRESLSSQSEALFGCRYLKLQPFRVINA